MAYILAHKAEFLGIALIVSELLDAVPSIQASSLWKLAYNFLKSFKK